MDFVQSDYDSEVHSPTDSSEDSVEVKICPISVRNKRKCAEPRKVPENYPLKKRMCLKVKAETESSQHPFRPWTPKQQPISLVISQTPSTATTAITTTTTSSSSSSSSLQLPLLSSSQTLQLSLGGSFSSTSYCYGEAYFRPPTPIKCEDAPATCIVDEVEPVELTNNSIKTKNNNSSIINISKTNTDKIINSCDKKNPIIRVPVHPTTNLSNAESEILIKHTNETFPVLNQTKREQRNYKNMTRERRIEANARERTRVHTISAAFDTLRKSIPSYSHNQKLSKLSVLRIACSYIMTLSTIISEGDKSTTANCVDLVTKTIQREGKLRKKKDDND